jgi:hypothetical protein
MDRAVARWGILVALTVMALCACTVSGASQTAPPASGSTATRSGSAAGSGTSTGSSPGSSPGARKTADPRASMPIISPSPVARLAYGPASAADRTRFAPALKVSGGLLVSSSVHTLAVAGSDVGGVAVYATKPGATKSTTFQDQYVVQLVNAVAGPKASPRFFRAGSQVIALSTHGVPVAGWFHGDRLTLVYRTGSAPDLAVLALGVRATPPPT